MNKSVFKVIILLSIFLGIVSGVLTIVPYVGEIVFWLLITISAPIVMIFLMLHNFLEIVDVRQSVVIGSLIGFVSFLTFSAVYIPSVILLAKYIHYSSNYGVSLLLSHSTFGLIVMLAIFMGILSATINSFSGFVTYYIVEFKKSLNNNNQQNFKDEQFYDRK